MLCTKERDIIKEEIELLKIKQTNELSILKNELNSYYESILPIQLIRNAIASIAGSSEIKKGILNNLTGIVAGFISKKIILGKTRNFFTKTLGNIFQFVIANIVSVKLAKGEATES